MERHGNRVPARPRRSFLVSGAISAVALPFLAKARRIERPRPDDRAPGQGRDAGVRGPAAGRVEHPA